MRISRVLIFAVVPVIFLLSSRRAPAALENRPVAIRDGGYVRSFRIATDEIGVKAPGRGFEMRRTALQRDPEAVRQRARDVQRAEAVEADLVLYEEGVPRHAFTRRFLTRRILVEGDPNLDVGKAAAGAGAVGIPEFVGSGCAIVRVSGAGDAIEVAERLRLTPGVRSADPLLARLRQKRFTPNDPLFPEQWHLLNTGQNGGVPGVDVNVSGVWDTYRGSNMVIAIVDDGLQTTHTDLYQNVNTVIDYDWNGGDFNPNPDVTADYHGTACAGVAAARGNNARGVSGAAPEATLVGLRLIAGAVTDADEAAAMAHSNDVIHLKSNSWGPVDDGQTLEGPGSLTAAALAAGCANGRGGRGTIYVWAGGNGRQYEDNANYDGYANSIYTIAIGAVGDDGVQASYSEPGACLIACAPSSSSGRQGITTVDLMGNNGYNYSGASGDLADINYTRTFGGTSSATPLAAGVVALMLQSNPNLGWRDVQEILIRTARPVSIANSDWITNAAGFHFEHKYGAGLVDANAAVGAASGWVNLDLQTNIHLAQTGLNLSIPDNSTAGVVRTFDFSSSNVRVEHATVTVDVTHPYRGDLAVILTSPAGTESRLAVAHGDPNPNYAGWRFMSVRNWGENARGAWRVKVMDVEAGYAGTLNSVRLDIYGTPATDLQVIKTVSDPNPVEGQGLTFDITATNRGPVSATDVIVTDALPSGLIFSNASATAGVYSNGLWRIPSISAGAFARLSVSAAVAAGAAHAVLTNTARLIGLRQLDFNGSNDAASVSLSVQPLRRISASAGACGTIAPSGEVAVAGSSASFAIRADAYYHVADILTNAVSVGGVRPVAETNYMWSNLPETGTIHAVFGENVASNGTPEWWLAAFGLTNGTFDTEELLDGDGDGMPAWQEYVAGTVPTSRASVLRIVDLDFPAGGETAIRWLSQSNRQYSVWTATNMFDGFRLLTNRLPADPPTNSYIPPPNGGGILFFRIGVGP